MDRFTLQLYITVSLLGSVCHCWDVKVPTTVKGIKKSCVLVPCSTDPYSKVSWYKYQRSGYPHVYSSDQSEIIDEFKGRTSVPGSAQEGNCSLRIDNLQNLDGEVNLYVWIWMHGNTNKGFYQQTTKINLLEPQKPNISVQSPHVEEGKVLTAKCTFRTSCPEPPPQLSWLGLRNAMNVVSHTQNRDTLWDTEATATFQVTRGDQGTHLGCETTLGGQSFQSVSVELEVLYAPTDVRVDYTGSRTVVEGHKVSLNCTSDSKPKPTHYEWVVTRNNTTTRFSGSTAELQDVTRDTSVICIATNSVGQSESKQLSLDVHYPPSILPGAFCSTENGLLKCLCQAEAKPNAVISWSINGSNALVSSFNTSTWDKGSMTVSELTGPWGQEGKVTCTATNLAGTEFNLMNVHSKRTGSLLMAAGAGAAVVCVIIGLVAAIVISKKRRRTEQPVDLDRVQPVRSDKKSNDYASNEDLYVNMPQAEQACKDQDAESFIYQNLDDRP